MTVISTHLRDQVKIMHDGYNIRLTAVRACSSEAEMTRIRLSRSSVSDIKVDDTFASLSATRLLNSQPSEPTMPFSTACILATHVHWQYFGLSVACLQRDCRCLALTAWQIYGKPCCYATYFAMAHTTGSSRVKHSSSRATAITDPPSDKVCQDNGTLVRRSTSWIVTAESPCTRLYYFAEVFTDPSVHRVTTTP